MVTGKVMQVAMLVQTIGQIALPESIETKHQGGKRQAVLLVGRSEVLMVSRRRGLGISPAILFVILASASSEPTASSSMLMEQA
jgi:hypothetical protein